jgi:hypothetical protein
MYFAVTAPAPPILSLTPSFTYGSRVDADSLQALPEYYISIASFGHTVNAQDASFF